MVPSLKPTRFRIRDRDRDMDARGRVGEAYPPSRADEFIRGVRPETGPQSARE